ncbi:hypothetical protein RB213_015749, partial [Colletotrichum asianum]
LGTQLRDIHYLASLPSINIRTHTSTATSRTVCAICAVARSTAWAHVLVNTTTEFGAVKNAAGLCLGSKGYRHRSWESGSALRRCRPPDASSETHTPRTSLHKFALNSVGLSDRCTATSAVLMTSKVKLGRPLCPQRTFAAETSIGYGSIIRAILMAKPAPSPETNAPGRDAGQGGCRN